MMDTETQKFMVLEDLHTWAMRIIVQAAELNSANESLLKDNLSEWHLLNRSFRSGRHLFLLSANRMRLLIAWARQLNFLDEALWIEFSEFSDDIKFLRDKNEHVIEYYSGERKPPTRWMHTDENGSCDATATVGTLIGGRLDWNRVSDCCLRLLLKLPPHYYPNRVDQ